MAFNNKLIYLIVLILLFIPSICNDIIINDNCDSLKTKLQILESKIDILELLNSAYKQKINIQDSVIVSMDSLIVNKNIEIQKLHNISNLKDITIYKYKQIDSLHIKQIELYKENIEIYNKRNKWYDNKYIWFGLGLGTLYISSEIVNNVK